MITDQTLSLGQARHQIFQTSRRSVSPSGYLSPVKKGERDAKFTARMRTELGEKEKEANHENLFKTKYMNKLRNVFHFIDEDRAKEEGTPRISAKPLTFSTYRLGKKDALHKLTSRRRTNASLFVSGRKRTRELDAKAQRSAIASLREAEIKSRPDFVDRLSKPEDRSGATTPATSSSSLTVPGHDDPEYIRVTPEESKASPPAPAPAAASRREAPRKKQQPRRKQEPSQQPSQRQPKGGSYHPDGAKDMASRKRGPPSPATPRARTISFLGRRRKKERKADSVQGETPAPAISG